MKLNNNILDRSIDYSFILILLFFAVSIAVYNIFSVLLLLFIIIKKIKDKDFGLIKTSFNKYLFLFFMFSFFSIFKGDNFYEGFDILLSPIFSYIVLFLISLEIIDISSIKKYFRYIFIGGFIFIAFGLYSDFYKNINYFYRNNQFATTSGFLIIIFVVYLIYGDNNFFRIFSIFGVSASIIANKLSYSRGAMLALLTALIILISLVLWDKFNEKLNKKLIISVISITIIIFILVIPFLMPDRLIERFKNTNFDKNTNGRLVLYRASVNMIKNNPILGVGISSFNKAYNDYLQNNLSKKQISRLNLEFGKAHNVYLDIAAKQGIVSLILFIIILYKALKIGLNNFFDSNNSNEKLFSLVFISLLIFSIIHSFVDTTIYFHHVALYLIIFCVFNYRLSRENFK